MSSNRKLTIVSWNVRGLGEDEKCIAVRDTLVTCHPTVACIQETKLSAISPPKFRSFLPANLGGHCFLAADGSRGGVTTTWDDSQLTLLSADIRSFSVTTTLTAALSDLTFTLTNVYAPSDHQQTPEFLDELREIAGIVTGPWIIAGDFNLIRTPDEKNNDNFNAHLAEIFNLAIHDLSLVELPLLDRLFTWSKKREIPTLARLD